MNTVPGTKWGGKWGVWSLCAVVALAYTNAMGGVFQFDDFNVIVDLATVHSLQAWWADAGQGIRPLLKLSYTANWTSGWGAPGFHAVNILVHAATVCVVFALSGHLLAAWNIQGPTHRMAWFAAALFALHPAHTEAVTYISGRSGAGMALLYLLGVWVHAGHGPRPGPDPWASTSTPTPASTPTDVQRPWLAAACFVLALATKETAVTFPLALLLWDRSCGVAWGAALRRAWPSWAVLLVAMGFFGWNDAYRAAMQRSLEFNSVLGNLATQANGLAYLARQWVLPLWPNIDPDLPVLSGPAEALPALLGLAGVCSLIFSTWRTRPWWGLGLAWVVLHLLPLHLVLPRLDVANDRQLYLASAPLGLAVVVAVQRGLDWRWAQRGVAGVLVGCAMLTVQRNHDYRSEIALWEQTAAQSSRKSRVYNNLGYAYQEAGRAADARLAYLRALQLEAGNTKARLNLRRLNARQATPLTAPQTAPLTKPLAAPAGTPAE